MCAPFQEDADKWFYCRRWDDLCENGARHVSILSTPASIALSIDMEAIPLLYSAYVNGLEF